MAAHKSKKITKYPRVVHLNIGIILYIVIFIYLIMCIFMYANSKQIIPYEVQAGALSANNIYKAIALREETVVTSKDNGYINYFAREGSRAAVGDLVYAIDESGKLSEYLHDNAAGENQLSEQDLSELKTEVVGFSNAFNPQQFSSIYDFKYDMEGMVLKLSNYTIMDSIAALQTSGLTGFVKKGTSPLSGIITYSVDGYEDLQLEQMTNERFDLSQYQKSQLIGNHLVSAGDPVFKVSTSEDWSLIIPIDEEREQELIEAEYVLVRFLKNQNTSWGQVKTFTNENGEIFASLSFTNSMITFCNDRFVDIELILEDEIGLKIPNSSIVEKDFFIVPKEYITKGGKNGSHGVLREIYLEDGSMSTEFIDVTIYNETETDCYLDNSVLQIGDYLIKPESTEKYGLSKRGSLIGVYNINKGYADFKQIQVLYSNDEYSIVQSNTAYGLNVYDYIVLDASSVIDNELIYE